MLLKLLGVYGRSLLVFLVVAQTFMPICLMLLVCPTGALAAIRSIPSGVKTFLESNE